MPLLTQEILSLLMVIMDICFIVSEIKQISHDIDSLITVSNIGDYGDKFYIILEGSVGVLIPNFKRRRTVDKGKG